jgi:hypothetical protein
MSKGIRIPAVVKEYVMCPKDGKLVEMEICRKCDLHSRYFALGMNRFVMCLYEGEIK